MNTKFVGDIGENIAVDTLTSEGYRILERNAEYCGCEVDIICDCFLDDDGRILKPKKSIFGELLAKLGIGGKKTRANGEWTYSNIKQKGERVIVFCEVKTRYGDEYGAPEEAVTPYKVGRYVTASKAFLKKYRLSGVKVRFDIFAVDADGCRHIVDAFNENDAKYPRNLH